MDVIALTGGIAAGKSTVAARLRELGAVVIDADALARDAVAPESPALARIVERFGPAVLAADGSLDRAALGRLVFSDPAARSALNAIVHPEVGRLYRAAIERERARDPRAIVVYDVPLLAEARAHDEFAFVVVVDAPAAVRERRLVDLRGMSPEEAAQRVAAQVTDEERRSLADIIIDASGELSRTLEQTDALWRTLRSRASVGSPE